MALRLEDVHPPKTAAVQSCWISFPARSANFVGSLAPSSLITWSCLPMTPPAALISSAARLSESKTVFSLIAMVPESELMNPTLTLLPVVSTQELLALAVELAEAGSDIWLPQPARAVAIAAAVRGIKARLVTATLMITCFSLRAASRQRLVSRIMTGTREAQSRSELFPEAWRFVSAPLRAPPAPLRQRAATLSLLAKWRKLQAAKLT
jgi:hypothetical protein